ncbi:MAG: prepilin-type N-terminal cleavage/methylation domain-containing protein [Planctomycetaceae bacterium]
MKCCLRRNGFSLLEVIAAVVILAVVAAATVATVGPMRAKSDQKLSEKQTASLNSMSQTYFLELGQFPPDGVNSLVTAGYLSSADAAAKAHNAKLRADYSYSRTTGTFVKK